MSIPEATVSFMLRRPFWLFIITGLVLSCSKDRKTETISYPVPGHKLTTEELAQAYCGACHQFPEPELLSKSLWEQKVLKDMGRRLGIRSDDYDPFARRSMYDAFMLRRSGVYPTDTLISQEDWQKIESYYLDQAPSQVEEPPDKPTVTKGLGYFKTKIINDLPAEALSTMVKFDTVSGKIYWGSRTGDLMIVSPEGHVDRQIQLDNGVSALLKQGDQEYVLTMGGMDPTEEATGKLVQISKGYQSNVLLEKLQRPVHFSLQDLNNDGLSDILVSQFGDQTGKLSWFEKQDTDYLEHTIKSIPGVIKTYVNDYDDNGKLDIMALMTQGNEGISVFYNQGQGNFIERQLLRFPPVYGSSSFQLIDFNGDGALDILYTAGDNADFTYSLKAYHGIRIYYNNGDFSFTERYFYPMYGAMNAKAGDFDHDGDIDIAAISFFPDFDANEPEGFVYLENQGDLFFKPSTFSESVNGRWLVMDVEDFDRDGDLDLVLGSLLFKIRTAPEELIDRWSQSNYHLVILENTTF